MPTAGGIGRHGLSPTHDVAARGIRGDGRVNLFEDVAARTELAQGLLPALRELPGRRRDALGEPDPFEMLEASDEHGRRR